jgi:hypothetical protein
LFSKELLLCIKLAFCAKLRWETRCVVGKRNQSFTFLALKGPLSLEKKNIKKGVKSK